MYSVTKFLFPLATLALLAPAGASGANPPDPQMDRRTLEARSDNIPGARQALDQLEQMIRGNSGAPAADQSRQIILGNFANLQDASQLPVNIAAVQQAPMAERRGYYAQQLVAADLNGDWQITRDELLYALSGRRTDKTAELFILGDTDQDGTLSHKEIEAAIQQAAARDVPRRGRELGLLPVLDLDGDGMFTQDELERVLAALSQ